MGHAIRSIEIVRAISARAPDLTVGIRTSISREFFRENLDPCPEMFPPGPDRLLDVGIVQIDNLKPDLKNTLTGVQALLKQGPELIRREKKLLADCRALAVVADVPFLALAAAKSAGLLGLAVGNFTWDWIYRSFGQLDPAWTRAADAIADYYRQADLMIRLPMSPDMSTIFNRVVDVGLTGRKAALDPGRVREQLGIAARSRLILVALTDLRIAPDAVHRLADNNPECVFVYSSDLPLKGPSYLRVDTRRFPYPDLAGAADAILTKPGYGITADALANMTPIFYTDRGPFPEYPLLVSAIEKYLPHGYLPSEKLYQGCVRLDENSLKPPQSSGRPGWNGNGAGEAAVVILKECGYKG